MSNDQFRVFLSAVTSEFGRARDALAADLRSRDTLLRGNGGCFLNTKFFVHENMYCHDFYCLRDNGDFVDRCVRSIRQIRDFQSSVRAMSNAEIRGRAYAFCRCASCDFAILTNRDPGESLACRLCEAKHPVAYVNESALASLADQVNEGLGFGAKEGARQDSLLLVGYWPANDEQRVCIDREMNSAGLCNCQTRRARDISPGQRT
jgi:hypothetical protein